MSEFLFSSIRSVLGRLKVQEFERLTDAELLRRYTASRDEAAFTALVSRHGPTVLSVCRRVVREADVDDTFQATFLALAKQAGSIRRQEGVGVWLYEVAYNTALKARTRRARSEQVERAAALAEARIPADEVGYRDLQAVFDEELHRLPERLRQPLVLIHLLGQIQADAARQLGITDRALRKRLRVGRERLRVRLTHRGVGLTAAAIAVALDRMAIAGPVPPSLLRPTVQSVMAYVAGQTTAMSASTVALSAGGVGGMLARKFKLLGLVGPASALAVLTAYALTPAPDRPAVQPNHPTPDIAAPDPRIRVLTGQIQDADGRPVPNAAVTALVRKVWQSTDRGLHDEVIAHGDTDADGRYRLVVPADFPTWSTDRRVTLVATAAGHAPITGDVSLERPVTTDLRLAKGAAARGRLIGPDGRPAPGVRLAVVRLGTAVLDDAAVQPPRGWPADVMTGPDGEYRLDGMPTGENLWLQVRDERFALTTFRVAAGGESMAVTLTGSRLLTGRITSADTGRPLAGARIGVLVGPDQATLDYYTAMAAAPDVSAAAPPAEVEVRTDAEGRYRLRLPPAASYRVYASPPEGTTYLGWSWPTLAWSEGETSRERSAALPPAVEVRGRVVDEDGRPITGAGVLWMHDSTPDSPTGSSRANTVESLVNSDVASLTGVDGRFRVALPAVPIMLRVFGPGGEYQLDSYEYERCPQCGQNHWRAGENARVRLDLTLPALPTIANEVKVTLRRGTTVTGRAVGPDGRPIRDGVLICRNISQPLRRPAPQPLPIRNGVFELPGCVPDRVYPALLLDLDHNLAGLAGVQLNQPMPTVQLAACGSAAVRLTDAAGRPVVGERAVAWFWLEDDRPAIRRPKDKASWSNPLDASWVDPRHFLPGPVTGVDGVVTVSGMVPGLQYQLKFADRHGQSVVTVPFQVEAGQMTRVPDVVLPAAPGTVHQIGNPPNIRDLR
jgi:RNA polymerase sigma factor (sigma-70 family)